MLLTELLGALCNRRLRIDLRARDLRNRFPSIVLGRLNVADWGFQTARFDVQAIGATFRRAVAPVEELVRKKAAGRLFAPQEDPVDWPTLEYRVAESIETFLAYSGSRELFTGDWHVVIDGAYDVSLTREPGFHSNQIFVAKVGKPNNLSAIRRLMDLDGPQRRSIVDAISTEIVTRAKLLHAA